MVLFSGASLQQHPPLSIEHENRDGAMEATIPVDVELWCFSERIVARIDEDDEFFLHEAEYARPPRIGKAAPSD